MKKLKLAAAIGCLLILGVVSLVWATGEYNKNQEAAPTQDTHVSRVFHFAYDKEEAEKLGVISLNSHDTKPKKLSAEIITAIKNNPGMETGIGFRAPLDLKSADADCQLFGFDLQLNDQPDTQQWLVAPLPPCGKYKPSQSNTPFWLVEKKTGKIPKVLLAYRSSTLATLTQKHEGYADILITYLSSDGNDIYINWRYQDQGYTYRASMCSNLNPINANEPAFFTDCAPVERWSTQPESETDS